MSIDTTEATNLAPASDDPNRLIVSFLSRADVAEAIGLKSVRSLSGMTLPPHDAEIGTHKGWLPKTIEEWQAMRPGRGRWGPRSSSIADFPENQ